MTKPLRANTPQVLCLPVLAQGVRLRTLAAAGLVCFGASQTASAQIRPVACDSRVYISQGFSSTLLQRRNHGDEAGIFNNVGTGTPGYNALGVNPDGFMYAIQVDSEILLQIDPEDGSVTTIGPVTDLPAPSDKYNAGAFSPDGVFYVKHSGGGDTLYAIDISTNIATPITLSQNISIADLAWAADSLYSVTQGGQLVSIDVTSGGPIATVAEIGAPDTGRTFGAMFGFADGLFGAANNGSGYYQINLDTGIQRRLSAVDESNENDGANCPRATSRAPAAAPVPTLGEWSLALLAGLMGLAGIAGVRRRRNQQ